MQSPGRSFSTKKRRRLWLASLAIGLLALPGAALAERGHGSDRSGGHRGGHARSHRGGQGHAGVHHKSHRGRYHRPRARVSHRRHSPRHGHRVRHLSRHSRTVWYRGHRHYYDHGVWYRPYRFGWGYVVAAAPLGAVVTVLPPYYTTTWVYGVPYYFANTAYYRWSPAWDGYQVVSDPRLDLPPPDPEPFVYPSAGQTEEQQSDDRYACHRWAVDQTGFDPSLGLPPGEAGPDGLRSDYHRAMSACLEGRSYTVR